jgi:hypothetical protein
VTNDETEHATPDTEPTLIEVTFTASRDAPPMNAVSIGVGFLRALLIEAGCAVTGDAINFSHRDCEPDFGVPAGDTTEVTVSVHGLPHPDIASLARMRDHIADAVSRAHTLSPDLVALYNETLTGPLLPAFPPPGNLTTVNQQGNTQSDT